MLREQRVAIIVGLSKVLKRQGWQDEWLDEPLDLRPHPDNVTAIKNLKDICSGAKSWNKKKGRRKKADSNEASQ